MIETLMVLSFVMAGMLGLTKIINLNLKASRSIQSKGDLESIRALIRSNLDCIQTMPSNCALAGYIPVKRKDGTTFIGANGASGITIGDWSIRTTCSGTNLLFERAQLNSDETFKSDPLLNRSYDWQPLFPSGAVACPTLSPSQSTVPTGMLAPFPLAAVPTGWLACNGQAVSRTDYAALFTAIGTTYGAGDGTTTFNLPHLEAPQARALQGGYRYYRYHVTAIGFPSGGVLAITEINFKVNGAWLGNTGGTKIGPYPVTITNSTANPSTFTGAQAFDGIASYGIFFQSTNFASTAPYNGDAWIRVDFGTGVKVNITGINISAIEYTVSPKTWQLEGSQDGVTWITIPGSAISNVHFIRSFTYEFAGTGLYGIKD